MASVSLRIRELRFITEPDDSLTCRICLKVARDPWQHGKCGILFCKKCISKYGRVKTCPHCKERRPQYFEDNRSKREIGALCVKCDNIERGCKWKGTVDTLDNHMTKTCQFTPIPCPNKCKDGRKMKHVMKKDIKEHVIIKCPNREHQCEYCGKKDTFVSITEEHDKICERKIVPCTNTECTMTMERGKVEAHVANDCEYSEISCKYESIGCDVKKKRRDMKDHEEDDDKVHLNVALNTIVGLKKTIKKVEETTGELKETTDKLKQTTDEFEETTDGLKGMIDELKETPDELKGESTTFKLTDYEKRKHNNEYFKSPSIYTSPTGYHMYFKVCPTGCYGGVGTHVSVFAHIMEGKYDGKLKWPLIGKVSIEILNQLEDKNHYKEDIYLTTGTNIRHDGNSNWGYPQFIPHSQLSHDPATNTQYLKDDTLYFRVSVKISDHKPWLECTAAD